MNNKAAGKVFHLILASIMTVSIVLIAFLLNSIHIPPIVPATAIISTDYQVESAVIMLLQKTRNNPLQKTTSLTRDILPGVTLKVEGKTEDGDLWTFAAEVKGTGLDQQVKIQVDKRSPDRLIYIN